MDVFDVLLISAGLLIVFEIVFWLGECFGNAAADAEIAAMRRREEERAQREHS